MSNELTIHSAPVIPYSDMEKMAGVIAQSGLFGVRHPVQALALMLVAQAEGLHPATAAQDYHIIQGRPALRTDAMLARFQAAGGKVQWHDYTDDVVSATFSHPAGGSLRVEWTIERARTAGLAGKETWKQYPRAMLRARVISEGIRAVYPGVLSGMYTPEEIRDMAPHPAETVEVKGPSETTGPLLAPAYDLEAAGFVIQSIADVTELRIWLAGERKRMGWRPGDPLYEALKGVAAARAEEIEVQKEEPHLDNRLEKI